MTPGHSSKKGPQASLALTLGVDRTEADSVVINPSALSLSEFRRLRCGLDPLRRELLPGSPREVPFIPGVPTPPSARPAKPLQLPLRSALLAPRVLLELLDPGSAAPAGVAAPPLLPSAAFPPNPCDIDPLVAEEIVDISTWGCAFPARILQIRSIVSVLGMLPAPNPEAAYSEST